MEQHDLSSKCTLLMGTIFGRLEPQRLVDWIVQDRLAVRMQLQMHKYIWEPKARGV
jgi:7-carboxy-7-deazaguanine synthase